MLYKMKLSFCQVFLVFAAGFIRKCHLKLSALQKRIKIFSFQGDDIAYTEAILYLNSGFRGLTKGQYVTWNVRKPIFMYDPVTYFSGSL